MFTTQSPAAISATGNWSDVGHYAQMVWRGTTRVGCATVKYPSGTDMVGICRYSPAGNFSDQWAYGPNSKPATIGSTLEDKVLKHFNGPRWSSGVQGLTWDPALAQQAQASLQPRLDDQNLGAYQPPFGELIGESTYSGATTPLPPSPRSLIVGWINGGYRGAIVDPKNTRIGCATGAKASGTNHRRILLCRLAQAS